MASEHNTPPSPHPGPHPPSSTPLHLPPHHTGGLLFIMLLSVDSLPCKPQLGDGKRQHLATGPIGSYPCPDKLCPPYCSHFTYVAIKQNIGHTVDIALRKGDVEVSFQTKKLWCIIWSKFSFAVCWRIFPIQFCLLYTCVLAFDVLSVIACKEFLMNFENKNNFVYWIF